MSRRAAARPGRHSLTLTLSCASRFSAGGAAAAALPFDKLVFCNIGNPQSLGQQPITFVREVLALVNHPKLLDHPEVERLFAPDAVARARKLISSIPGGVGAYSETQGVAPLRDDVAAFISERDGIPARADQIFLTDGASPAVQAIVRALIRDRNDASLIPIPQYPLYTASIALYGGSPAPYYLHEESGWSTDVADMERALAEARSEGRNVRSCVVINPGNPTGALLTRDNMVDVIKFCVKENLVLCADEVYQENIWEDGATWHSFKKVAAELGVLGPANDGVGGDLQLASFHSVSKGFLGECGHRGGYMELVGFPDDVRLELYKMLSVSLCSNVDGQVAMSLMVNPPAPGDHSYALYVEERDAILASLKRRAAMLSEAFTKIDGVDCQTPAGALYAFPRIDMPEGAIRAAKEQGVEPDFLYCMELLNAAGLVCVPGSGFGQVEGTFHFRTTILPPEDEMELFVTKFTAFHEDFTRRYSE